ncbi:hypothetical protein [Brevundimonas sp.]|uniref:hypothetical protein n=1 Tax=Brevundimonas sp. TaxID=1871086 RepID=UPI0025B8C16B|nr:hypothetical protein [Brevundimonas sp.]
MLIRPLTAGERDLVVEVFGDALTLDGVRILASPFPRAFVPGRWFGRDWIVWPRRGLPDDIAAARLRIQATFIHELVHVWQAQQGTNLLLAKLKAGDSRAAYVYPIEDCAWDGLNIEQQASAVEHAFRLSRGGAVPANAAFYRAVAPFPCGLKPT